MATPTTMGISRLRSLLSTVGTTTWASCLFLMRGFINSNGNLTLRPFLVLSTQGSSDIEFADVDDDNSTEIIIAFGRDVHMFRMGPAISWRRRISTSPVTDS